MVRIMNGAMSCAHPVRDASYRNSYSVTEAASCELRDFILPKFTKEHQRRGSEQVEQFGRLYNEAFAPNPTCKRL